MSKGMNRKELEQAAKVLRETIANVDAKATYGGSAVLLIRVPSKPAAKIPVRAVKGAPHAFHR